MTHAAKAGKLFDMGYNCSQSVAAAFSEEMGMDVESVCAMTAGFGGGVGRLREVCGALCGMTFVVGKLTSTGKPGDEEKAKMYEFVQQLAADFKRANGSIVCRELLGLDDAAPISATPEARTAEYYKKRPCRDIVEIAADMLSKALKERNII
ncbi:MAG: C_GCAxxG_C_C family protein [Ruminococcaceae bacterium]|jgi:C_GCAxxG_C_C family probable redox protein|nr:C_GCAxxG_C_C family protein [Oscillospiraceae bacterium]